MSVFSRKSILSLKEEEEQEQEQGGGGREYSRSVTSEYKTKLQLSQSHSYFIISTAQKGHSISTRKPPC